MSGRWFPITSAEQLVRHLLRWDNSADEIERRLADNSLWHFAEREEVKACHRLILQRRRYDAAIARALARGLPPTEESVAGLVRPQVDVRTVQRWRTGV